MSLQSEFDAFKAQWTERVGPESAKMMSEDIASQASMVGMALKEGDAFPVMALPDQRGGLLDIAAVARAQPVVVTFYRGGWCPYCSLELRAYQKILPEIQQLGARLVAVSPEVPDSTLTTAEKNELSFSVLSDINGALADALGIRNELSTPVKAYFLKAGHDLPTRNGDGRWSLPIPATYVVGRDSRIVTAQVDPDYRKRQDPQSVLDALRDLATRT